MTGVQTCALPIYDGPEIFILRDLRGAEVGNGAGGGTEVRGVGLGKKAAGGERACEGGCLAKEGSAVAGHHTKHCRRLSRPESTGKYTLDGNVRGGSVPVNEEAGGRCCSGTSRKGGCCVQLESNPTEVRVLTSSPS